MDSVGKKFEIVFNEYFNNQQDYKHKVDLLKSINKEFNSQNLNNLFGVISITPIMIEVCKALSINLNFLAGLEENKFIYAGNRFHYTENELISHLQYNHLELKQLPTIYIKKLDNIISFQTNSISLFFNMRKSYIIKSKGGICGIALIACHFEQSKLLIKFNINEDFIAVEKKDIEVIAEEQ